MTIAAGFCSHEGIVLGTDSEETTGSFKISKEKLAWWRTGDRNVAAAIVGTGEAVFCDMIAEELWQVIATAARDSDAIISALKAKLIAIHERYHKFSTEKVEYEVDMLIALGIKSDSARLFHAQGPAISEVTDFRCIGFGLELGNYIASRIWEYGTTIEGCSVVMIYLLQQVKKYVRFCGGDSHIMTMTSDGKVENVRQWLQADVTNFLEQFEHLVASAMRIYANPESDEDDLQFAHKCLGQILGEHRNELKQAVESRKQWLSRLNKKSSPG